MSTYALLAHTAASGLYPGLLSTAADGTFVKSTINAVLTDSSTMLTLASSAWTHSATGIYQINADISFGVISSNVTATVRAGLYNISSTAFATNIGGSNEILSTAGQASGTNSPYGRFVNISGRYEVSSTAHQYAIYMAGDVASGTFTASTAAQGVPAGIASKPEIYKLVQIIKE